MVSHGDDVFGGKFNSATGFGQCINDILFKQSITVRCKIRCIVVFMKYNDMTGYRLNLPDFF